MNRCPERRRELSEQAMSRLLRETSENRDFINPKLLLVILIVIALAVVFGVPFVAR